MARDTRREEWLPTRSTLLRRIRDPDDADGWQEFYETYRQLIRKFARRRGLSEADAEDVTQDTMVTVQKTMGRFQYDPQRCSFKSWLGRLADQRITDFLRRQAVSASPRPTTDATDRAARDLAPDPAGPDPDAVWEAEWRQGVITLALQRLKDVVKPLSYQAFYLHSIKGQPPRQVAQALGIGVTKVYLETHRAGRVFRRIAAKVRLQMEQDGVVTVAANGAP